MYNNYIKRVAGVLEEKNSSFLSVKQLKRLTNEVRERYIAKRMPLDEKVEKLKSVAD